MAIRPYLAMTAAEIAQIRVLPEKAAGMYCPFAEEAYLPRSSGLLVLTDSTPADVRSAGRLTEVILRGGWDAVLLDFQRPGDRDALTFAERLLKALPCPTIVSDLYAQELDCPVFLSPLPLNKRLREHIVPWKGRDIWLDISTGGERITLTEQGTVSQSLARFQSQEKGHTDKALHCHYSIAVSEEEATFTLWRTRQDLEALLQEAEDCGVKAAVGLYQELGTF